MATEYEIKQTSTTSYKVKPSLNAWEQGEQVGRGAGVAIGLALTASRALNNFALSKHVDSASKALTTGELDAAVKAANWLIDDKDKESKILGYYYLAATELMERAYTYSVEYANKAIALMEEIGAPSKYPEMAASIYLMRGTTYLELGEIQLALRDLTMAIRLSPQEPNSYLIRSRALRHIGDLQQALSDANSAVQLEPSDVANYLARGRVYAEMKSNKDALADFSRALSLDSGQAAIYMERGKLFASTGNYLKAIQDLDEVVRLSPDNAEGYKTRASIYHQLGNESNAAHDEEKFVSLKNADEVFKQYLREAQNFYHKHEIAFRKKTGFAFHIIEFEFKWVSTTLYSLLISAIVGITVFIFTGGFVPFFPTTMIAFAIILFASRIAHSRNEQEFTTYWAEVQSCDKMRPGFATFYVQYLTMRTHWDERKLFSDTQTLIAA